MSLNAKEEMWVREQVMKDQKEPTRNPCVLVDGVVTRYITPDEAYQLVSTINKLREELQQAHRDATEEVAKAHKRGWEQAKTEAKVAVECADYDADDWSRRNPEHVATAAIAAMEYGGKAND